MEVKIYNSLTNQLETFKPIKDHEVSMYVCGPTVYDDIHIGNARPIVLFDTISRFFKLLGYQVKYVSNFTDIDDKIIKKAKDELISEQEVTTKYIDHYLKICESLNCEELYNRPKVTEWINSIIQFIDELMKNDLAYKIDDNVYFRIQKAKEYGILSNQKIAELEVGSRIESDEKKEDPRDFVLWKLTSDEGIKWDSPFGKGRPGWHTECCVMIEKIFGGKIDIHGGGNDLKFPHHENEIAQISSLRHHYIANYWIHNGRIDIDNQKMSKSIGNTILTKDLLKEYNPNGLRLMLLSSNYRQNLNFTTDLVEQACQEFSKIEKAYISLYRYLELNNQFNKGEELPIYQEYLNELANDFNTPNAITCIQKLVKEVNILMRNKNQDINLLNAYLVTFDKMLYGLGLVPSLKKLNSDEILLVKEWMQARTEKDFEKADKLRAQIQEAGIVL